MAGRTERAGAAGTLSTGGIYWTDRDQLLADVARQEDLMVAVQNTKTIDLVDLDQDEVGVLVKALETLLCVEMGLDSFGHTAMVVSPMLEKLGARS